MYLCIDTFHRYLGLFGDHIVPAVLYRFTQVLWRPDLINSKGKALVLQPDSGLCGKGYLNSLNSGGWYLHDNRVH